MSDQDKGKVLRLYFAHAVNIYNTPIEDAAVKLISNHFPSAEIENPNQLHHQIGYKKWAQRAHESDTKHKGMNYFFDEVLPLCNGCVAMPFLDRRMGLGVAGEAKWFIEKGLPVWIFVPTKNPSIELVEEFAQTLYNGLFFIRPIKDSEVDQLLTNDPVLVVPHEETRLRTWLVYNRQMRPYQEAHKVSMPIPDGFYPQPQIN